MSQVIQLDGALYDVQNDPIQVYASNTPSQLSDQFDHSIDSNALVGSPTLSYIIHGIGIVSTAQFGTSQLNQQIVAQSVLSTVAFGDSMPQLHVNPNSVTTTNNFGLSQLNSKIYANSLSLTNTFGTPKVNRSVVPVSLQSTVVVEQPHVNMFIDDVPFPSIESAVIVPQPRVVSIVKPLSIATTVNFELPVFIDNIHRLLVFKNDNISKVGDNDSVVIAGGIRVLPSSTKTTVASSGDATLPATPAGFLTVNIDGRDYKLPYYND